MKPKAPEPRSAPPVWIIETAGTEIRIAEVVDIQWDITEWDEGPDYKIPEVYALKINGIRFEFENIVTLKRQFPDGGIDTYPW